jgi:hypothetical protein
MKVGMLWFDGDRSIDLSSRIERAAAYYHDKYGRMPNLCILHPTTSGENTLEGVAGLAVQTSVSVLPDHFWLGIEEQSHATQSEARIAA